MKPTRCKHCGSAYYPPHGIVIEDAVGGRIAVGEERVVLPRRELLVLKALLDASPRTLPKAVLYELVYGYEEAGGPNVNSLESHVSKLRKTLREIGSPSNIRGIRHCGYTIEAGEPGEVA